MNSTAEGTEPVTDAARKRFPATVATQERITELLRPGVTDHLTRDGYVDTLRGQDVAAANRAQEVWQTAVGSVVYQRFLQPMMASPWAPGASSIADHLALRPGNTVADVGCGPGNVTRGLADAVRPHGLAVGLDLSEPMLTRASNTARPNTGLVRGDAVDLPLRENSVDGACATAVIMLAGTRTGARRNGPRDSTGRQRTGHGARSAGRADRVTRRPGQRTAHADRWRTPVRRRRGCHPPRTTRMRSDLHVSAGHHVDGPSKNAVVE